MTPYGRTKKKYKTHPANECRICGETKIIKGKARNEQKEIVIDELQERDEENKP